MLHMADTSNNSYNSTTDKISVGSRTGSAAGDMIADGSDRAEGDLEQIGERGEQYKQQARRQRIVVQRMRQLTENDEMRAQNVRGPRNAKFQEKKDKESAKLSNVDIVFMSCVALLFDIAQGLLSLIPVVGNAITAVTVLPAAAFTLYIMYKKRGIEFKSTKTLVKFWGSLCIGLIPVLSIFPEYLLNVILVSLEKKVEEKLKL